MASQKYLDPEKTPREMIQILPDAEQTDALRFIELGEQLNCKAQTRYAHSNRYWRCVFSTGKPNRVLFVVECTDEWWRIKTTLKSLERYKEKLDGCSEKMINTIKNAYDCIKCYDKCKGGAQFTLDGVEYNKCIGNSFYFAGLTGGDSQSLLMLLTTEAQL